MMQVDSREQVTINACTMYLIFMLANRSWEC